MIKLPQTLQERVHGAAPPTSWNLNKLHRVLRVRRGQKNTGMREDNLLSLSYGRIINKDIECAEGLLPESFETYQIVEPGNIIMRLTDLQNDKRSLRQGLVKERGIITSAYDALEVGKDHDSRFWVYALLALDLAKYYYSLGGGVRQSIKFADFPNDWIAAPDLPTQKAIANFLDRETARIDLLIEKKQRLMDVLSLAQSSATIRHLKPGFDDLHYDPESNRLSFLGLRPGWRRIRIKHLTHHMTSGSRSWGDQIQDDGELFLQSGCITRRMGVSTADAVRVAPQAGAEADRTRVKANDILVCITGGRTGAVGFVSDIDEAAYINQHVCLLRADPGRIAPRLLAHILFSEIGQLHFRMSQYGLKQGLGFNDVAAAAIPCPPRELQDSLCRQIENSSRRLDSIAQKADASIDRLRELRSSLITASVTGQIDPDTWSRRGTTDRRLDQIEAEMGA